MCGIAGVMNLREAVAPPREEVLVRMASVLRHRGPDGNGTYVDRRCGLAHTRLSIIDLANGQQPLCTEDRRFWITFNGELFNYPDLRKQLSARGHRFRTQSDTEVVLASVREWGEGAFERFNGQWACAVWDALERALWLSRDPFGIRPLYYAEREGQVWFASEVKALFAGNRDLPRRLDPLGLEETFTFWTVVPPQTPFAGIRELEPGHVRFYANGEVRDRAYTQLSFTDGRGSSETLEQAAQRVREALERATHRQTLTSDVPVGSYLSGGLDSSLVASLGREVVPGEFHTFSIRFEDAEYDETLYQRQMAELLGTRHHELLVTAADIAGAFPEVIRHAERPLLRTAPVPLFLLSKTVREAGIKVVLTGEGADELFAGYDLFREAKVRRFWARDPSSTLRPLLLERLYPYLSRSPVAQQAMARRFFGRGLTDASAPGFAHQTRWSTTRALQRLFSPELITALRARDASRRLLATLPPEFSTWSALSQDQYLEIRTLLAGYLLSSQGDRMLMAHSVEGRFPFLDPEVAKVAGSLPPSYRLRGLSEKHVLKRAAQGRVPPSILERTKQPYRAPDASAFFGPNEPEWVTELTSPRAISDAGVFDPGAVRQILAKCRGRADGQPPSHADNMAVVGVLSVQCLHREFIERAPEVPRPASPMRPEVILNPNERIVP